MLCILEIMVNNEVYLYRVYVLNNNSVGNTVFMAKLQQHVYLSFSFILP